MKSFKSHKIIFDSLSTLRLINELELNIKYFNLIAKIELLDKKVIKIGYGNVFF